MTPRVIVYKGATFKLPATRLNAAGAARSMVGTVTTAWVGTDAFQLPVEIVVTSAGNGEYLFGQVPAGTVTWPVGVWALYVQYIDAGVEEIEIVALLDVRVPA